MGAIKALKGVRKLMISSYFEVLDELARFAHPGDCYIEFEPELYFLCNNSKWYDGIREGKDGSYLPIEWQ